VQFGRLALLSNFLFVFGNAYGQYLVTVERYWIYGITPVLYTLGTITGAVFLTPVIGPYGPMVGTIGGAVIYVILRMIAVHRHGCPLSISLWHPDLLTMGKMMLPRILSLGALQLQLMYLNGFASSLTKGAVTINNYARNFESVLVGVIGISIAQAVYSRLSQTAVQRDKTAFSMYYTYGGIGTFLVCTAGAVVLAAMAVHTRNVPMPPYVKYIEKAVLSRCTAV
jgi:peptidoglycan biosynthesis protein MviN/MurJ (putative lipid II flippase)